MSEPEHIDVLILGSGGGGKLTAWHMGKTGRRTAVVERRWIGGSCPNIACLPSKNEIRSAEVAHLARHAAEFGTMTGPPRSTWRSFADGSAKWSKRSFKRICTTTRRAALN